MSIELKDIVALVKNNRRVIVAGDRQTGKTTLAAELINSSIAIVPSIKILYVSANSHISDYFKRFIPAEARRNIHLVNYQDKDNISNHVVGREYDIIIVDAYGELPPGDVDIILAAAQKEHSKVIFFTDIGTVRTATIGRYPTIVIGSNYDNTLTA
jgi:GTPase SAR1 family protein